MRKLFIATLLLTIGCGTPAFAADCKDKNSEQCPQTPGCYWENSAQTCNQCEANTYNDGTIRAGNRCDTCSSLSNYVTWIGTKLGLTSNTECEFKKTCPPYTYFVDYKTEKCALCSARNNPLTNTYYYGTKTTEYEVTGTVGDGANNLDDACAKCGNNSITNTQGNGCQCFDGYHVQDGTNGDTNNNSTDCVPNKYTITYIANNGKDYTIKRDATFGTSITTLTSDDDNKLVNPGYTLSAWKNDDKSLYILPGNSFTYNIKGDLELTAVWTGKTFTITYVGGDDADCNLSVQTCQFGTKCPVKDVNNCKYPGHVFRGWSWKCESGCENSNETIINPGDDISKLSGGENMTLSAIWDPCPAGYYCDINHPKETLACPAGSTSDEGSDQIDDCHMTGGTTKICDKDNKCFTLPAAVSKIFYHGTPQ